MDGDRTPTLTAEHQQAIALVRGYGDAGLMPPREEVWPLLGTLLDAVEHLVRRDDLLRKQLKAEQKKNRGKR